MDPDRYNMETVVSTCTHCHGKGTRSKVVFSLKPEIIEARAEYLDLNAKMDRFWRQYSKRHDWRPFIYKFWDYLNDTGKDDNPIIERIFASKLDAFRLVQFGFRFGNKRNRALGRFIHLASLDLAEKHGWTPKAEYLFGQMERRFARTSNRRYPNSRSN